MAGQRQEHRRRDPSLSRSFRNEPSGAAGDRRLSDRRRQCARRVPGPRGPGQRLGGRRAGREAWDPGPWLVTDPDGTSGTGLILFPRARSRCPQRGPARCPPAGSIPATSRRCSRRSGPARCCPSTVRAGSAGPACPATGWVAAADRPPGATGRRCSGRPVRSTGNGMPRVEAADARPGLRLVTEVEAVPGGAIRGRHTLTNTGQPALRRGQPGRGVPAARPGSARYWISPAGRRRSASRSAIGSATGCGCARAAAAIPAMTAATVLVAGVPGFTFGGGEVYGRARGLERQHGAPGRAGAIRPGHGRRRSGLHASGYTRG